MNEFVLAGDGGFFKITFEKVIGFPKSTSHFGGYDVEVIISIKSEGFSVISTFWTTTGEIYEFYNKLAKCNENVKGSVTFENYEGDLNVEIVYGLTGHLNVHGIFKNNRELYNKLEFEFISDQSYVQSTLKQLKDITEIYGGMKGIN